MAIDPQPLPLQEIAEQVRREVDLLTTEIGEIELLTNQARAEATRHEQKRAQAAEKLKPSSGETGREGEGPANQLAALTRRSAIMEAQVEILEGKLKVLARFRESLSRYSEELDESLSRYGLELDRTSSGGAIIRRAAAKPDTATPLPPAASRLVLAAQEDLRREIARAMHDGPAQSLTNIVLQAQIVERLLDRDPSQAKAEIGQLVDMVQHTLEATKAFIFDVRPMVLDDLGLVPTLRRVARDRGRRSQVPIEFESLGTDRRLPMDVESALFRIIDGTVTGFLSCHPDRISIRIDWTPDKTEARVAARREGGEVVEEAEIEEAIPRDKRGKPVERELPDALKAMIDETRAAKVTRAARANQAPTLPTNTWREIQQRSDTIGVSAELVDEGREVVLILASS